MMNYVQILCLCLLLPSILQGQFSDSFDDGDFTASPSWQGDVNNFTVNDDFELQLNDTDAGISTLYLETNIKTDFTWSWDMNLDFSPSDNNNARVYFFIDGIDVLTANGYYIEYGQNLAEDNLKFYMLTNGVSTLLGEGEMGALAQSPADLSIRIDRVDGFWTISTDYNASGLPVEEFSFMELTHQEIESGFFVLDYKYTSSNADAFFFDNLLGKEFTPDLEGPTFSEFTVVNNSTIEVKFDETLDESSLADLSLGVSPENTLMSSSIIGAQSNILSLIFSADFLSGPLYMISINGLTDVLGNTMTEAEFSFQLAVEAEVGDLVINEILFDPLTGGSDFVEILNVSDKIIDLQGLGIENNTKENERKQVATSIQLLPGGIVAFTEDVVVVKEDYLPPTEARIVENDIPSLNKADGNVTILTSSGEVIDSYNYTEDQHLEFLDDSKGVSLERIFANSASVEANFASGVATSNYATPGYENRNSQVPSASSEDALFIADHVFSPNADGDNDQLIMQLNLPQTGYLSKIEIFNVEGRPVRLLQNNQIVGQSDLARWDGLMDDGSLAPIGHYIVFFRAFNSEGDVIEVKKHVKLLDFF